MDSEEYKLKLKDPRWKRKRERILIRDKFCCKECGARNVMLNVHHIQYKAGNEPWDYKDSELTTLCETCHKKTHFIEPGKKREYDIIEPPTPHIAGEDVMTSFLSYAPANFKEKFMALFSQFGSKRALPRERVGHDLIICDRCGEPLDTCWCGEEMQCPDCGKHKQICQCDRGAL